MDDAQLGARLREVRRKRRLALADVESLSAREFKASVLGAYERGERQISVARLAKLVAIYDTSLSAFLDVDAAGATTNVATTNGGAPQPGNGNDRNATVDLAALERLESSPALRAVRESGHAVALGDDEIRALALALRRAMFEIESVLLDLERRGARAIYP